MTYATPVRVVVGVVIASGGEPIFHLYAFIMCISATAAGALKSVVQGILLSNEGITRRVVHSILINNLTSKLCILKVPRIHNISIESFDLDVRMSLRWEI